MSDNNNKTNEGVNTSLSEMESLVEHLALAKQQLEALADEEKKIQAIRRDLENQIMTKLKEVGNTSYVSKYGRASIKTSLSYRTPKDLDAKQQLFEYIKAKGQDVYLSLLSVNSQTLNAWAKQETQRAVEAGTFPFSIPGLDEPISYETISFRKS
jgi:subtilase family serine protease